MESLRKQLAEKGFRLTAQREAVLKTVRSAGGEHLTVEEIYDRTRVACPEIGIATVYRTVQLLTEFGVITRDYLGDSVVRYELHTIGDKHSHHHLRCLVCGKIIEVQDDFTSNLEEMILKRYGFEVEDHRIQFTGKCRECLS